MSKIINFLLVGVIVVLSMYIVFYYHEQHIYFKKLQILYQDYDRLISINETYLSQYGKEYSLLEIEKYAQQHLKMFLPKHTLKL